MDSTSRYAFNQTMKALVSNQKHYGQKLPAFPNGYFVWQNPNSKLVLFQPLQKVVDFGEIDLVEAQRVATHWKVPVLQKGWLVVGWASDEIDGLPGPRANGVGYPPA